MFPSGSFINGIIAFFFVADVWLIAATIVEKTASRRRYRARARWERVVRGIFSFQGEGNPFDGVAVARGERDAFLLVWERLSRSIDLPEIALSAFWSFTADWGVERRAEALLSSRLLSRRVSGFRLLSFVRPDTATALVRARIPQEKNVALILRLAFFSLSVSDTLAMDAIVETYRRGGAAFRRRLLSVLGAADYGLSEWAKASRLSADADVRALALAVAASHQSEWGKNFVFASLSDPVEEIRARARSIAVSLYPELIAMSDAFESEDEKTRVDAARAALAGVSLPSRSIVFRFLDDAAVRPVVVAELRRKLVAQDRHLDTLFSWYREADKPFARIALADALEPRLPYFLRRASGPESESIASLLRDSVSVGHYSAIIGFLNDDRDQKRREAIRRAIEPFLVEGAPFLAQCSRYLSEQIREDWNIADGAEKVSTGRATAPMADRVYYAILAAGATLSLPIAFVVIFAGRFSSLRPMETFVSYLFFFQDTFAAYVLASYAISLSIMCLSALNIAKQRSEWSLADGRFLFAPGLMPTVSVIAPAFNEEKTIVQSVRSLLSLEYPDYEVIVVNDGSKDRTLETLTEHFRLELTDLPANYALETAPVIGAYRSLSFPNLLVLNKLNGGKADSLNAGIAVASGEYVCGIDADTLLEPESLSRLLFRSVASGIELVAAGGNVIPINGCDTFLGGLRSIHFPKNRYARYQTVEYLRSFIAGRMGWARIGSLMIISGAFGIFRRERLLDVGGYLTRRGAYRRDTVGEDMEIVVRINEWLCDRKIPHVVDYAHNANGWTEVPEDGETLVRQRDRWHRGLLETMRLHRKMFMSPRYGLMGLVGFPYFYVFEMLGPFLEFTGYVSFLVLFFLGLLSSARILLMFAIVVLIGMMVSSAALYLSERGIVYFQGKDFASVLRQTLAENIGYRQYVSALRAYSYLAYILRGGTGWHKAERKGFRQGAS